MSNVLQNQKFSVILAVIGFLFVIAGFFEITDITKLAIKPSPTPLYPVLVIGLILIGTSVWIFFLEKKSSEFQLPQGLDTKPTLIEKGVFIAAPMNMFVASGQPENYAQSREGILKIIAQIRRCCGVKEIFYAGEFIEDVRNFELPDISLKDDFRLILEREYFVLFWPNKFASRSALIEAGIALTLNKKFICFAKNLEDLPFLLQGAQTATRNLKIIRYIDIDDLTRTIANSGDKIFDFSKMI
jgi:hypothetical protein